MDDTCQGKPYFSSSEQQGPCFALLFTVLFHIFILQSTNLQKYSLSSLCVQYVDCRIYLIYSASLVSEIQRNYLLDFWELIGSLSSGLICLCRADSAEANISVTSSQLMLLQSTFPSSEEAVEAVFPKHPGSCYAFATLFLKGVSCRYWVGRNLSSTTLLTPCPTTQHGQNEMRRAPRLDKKGTFLKEIGAGEAFSGQTKASGSNSEVLLVFTQQKVSLSVTEWCCLHTKLQLQRVRWRALHIISCNKEPC